MKIGSLTAISIVLWGGLVARDVESGHELGDVLAAIVEIT